MNALLDNYSINELQFMAEVVLPVYMRPYETLGTLLASFSGSKVDGVSKPGKNVKVEAESPEALAAKFAALGLVSGKIPTRRESEMW